MRQALETAYKRRIEKAIQRFVEAENWDDSFEILRNEANLLLTDDAEFLLEESIQAAYRRGVSYGQFLEMHLLVLRNARQNGIETARSEISENDQKSNLSAIRDAAPIDPRKIQEAPLLNDENIRDIQEKKGRYGDDIRHAFDLVNSIGILAQDLATASLIYGIIGLLTIWYFLIGVPFALVSIILGHMAFGKQKQRYVPSIGFLLGYTTIIIAVIITLQAYLGITLPVLELPKQ